MKDSTIRIRISKELESKFKEICDYEGVTQSGVLRELIMSYINAHPITTHDIGVQFNIEQYPETNPHSYYCYNITAILTGNLENIYDEVIFILPEFIFNGTEPYRIDSHYYHRKPLPGYYGMDRRILSAKFIDGLWKGVIFIYDDSLLSNPEISCFPDIEKMLKKNILSAISGLCSLPVADALIGEKIQA